MSHLLRFKIITAVLASTLGGSTCGAADPPKPLPKEIVDAWKKVGFTTNWSQVHASGAREFYPADKVPQAGYLPNFSAAKRNWKAGILKDLPTPEAAFSLMLGFAPVKDDDLKEIAKLKTLATLMLDQTDVTDAGLKELADHKNLSVLFLNGTKVTDAGLKELAKLKQLTVLSLLGVKVTESAVKELQKALPKCTIVTVSRS